MEVHNSFQEYCLKWNNHHSTLVTVLDLLLKQESLVDVTLAAEGKCIKVHRVVLCACSTYFKDLLCNQWDKQTIVFLKDVKFDQLQALVDYMYRGEVNVSHVELPAFLSTAEALKIKGLAERDEYQFEQFTETRSSTQPNSKATNKAGTSGVVSSQSSNAIHSQDCVPPQQKDNSDEDAPKSSESDNSLSKDMLGVLEPKVETVEVDEDITEGEDPRWNEHNSRDQDVNWTDDNAANYKDANVTITVNKPANCKITVPRFGCPTCPRSYKNRADMRKHTRYECGKEPRFPCPKCSSRFWRSYHLHRHLRQVHSVTV